MDFDIDYLAKGIIIGFAMAAPVGPIGVLCIRRTLVFGIVSGVATGLGAALADAVYGGIASFGMIAISDIIKKISPYMQFFGSIFLIFLGLRIFLSRPKMAEPITDANQKPHNPPELLRDFISSFFLTLTNPATILCFLAIFASLGLVVEDDPHYEHSALLIAGVFTGSLAWFSILSGSIGLFRHKLDRKGLRSINMISGMIIGGFGGAILGRLLVTKLMHVF